MSSSGKKVVVSGCFDLLHSGHVAFLNEASTYGELHVCLGSDKTVFQLKGRPTINNETERQFMLNALRSVTSCRINSGAGILDFVEELKIIKPDYFVVNEDGHTPQKQSLCVEMGIEYIILKRTPSDGLPVRSTTSLRTICSIPFRIDLAGGWLDQPFVSKFAHGPVLTLSIEPTVDFNHRSGMASSSRNKAIELWKTNLPDRDPLDNAKILFSYENPPGTATVAGSQDALGICLPGLNRLYYHGDYWPDEIESVHDESVLEWLENHIWLLSLGPRASDYDVLSQTNITKENAAALAHHAQECWTAILNRDLINAGRAMRTAFEAQLKMFPLMADENLRQFIANNTASAAGYKLSGAGGGGYLILLSEYPVQNALQIRARRSNWL